MSRTIIAAVITLAACASANVMRLDNSVRPETSPDSVVLLLEEPSRPYVSIALIEVRDGSWGLSLKTLGKKLVREAAALGGHAVILTQQSNSQSGLIPVGNTWVATEQRRLVGKVIVFTGSP